MIVRAAILATAALLACPPAATAQADTVHATLAADPDHRGPAAWTWIRAELLPRTADWPAGLSPWSALDLLASDDTLRITPASEPPQPGSYLTAHIDLADVGSIQVSADFDGLEHWSGSQLTTPRPSTSHFLNLLGLAQTPDPVVFDVPALVSNWLPALADGDPLYTLLTIGAAECETLTVQTDVRDGELEVVGRSKGGLLIPALLCYLADQRRGGASSEHSPPTDHWVLLAICARDAQREEAARQLAVDDDPVAGQTLERLLYTDDFTRIVAMDALIRRGDTRSLPGLLDAVSPEFAVTEDLAERALAHLLPRSSLRQQKQVLASLQADGSPRLRDVAARFSTNFASALPTGELDQTINHDGTDDRSLALAISCAFAFGLAIAIWIRAH